MRFEAQGGCPIVVSCTSVRCKTWTSKGYVCRHACVVGAHDFPTCGKLIERDNGAWWLRNMIRKEYRCETIRDLAALVSPTKSPAVLDDTAVGPSLRMPLLRLAHRSEKKAGRYRAFNEPAHKGRTPPKRKVRDTDAEAAQQLLLELDESDACVPEIIGSPLVHSF